MSGLSKTTGLQETLPAEENILFRQVEEAEDRLLQLFGKFPDVVGMLNKVINPQEIYKNLESLTTESDEYLKTVASKKGDGSLDFHIFKIVEKLRVFNSMFDRLAEHARMM